MEELFNILKQFILDNLGDVLEDMETKDCPLPMIKEKAIVFGPVDLSRYENSVICAIIPEQQDEEDAGIGETSISTRMTVAFIVQGKKHDILIKQMCRYPSAFRKIVISDYSLDGNVDETLIEQRKFYPDAGTVEKQACVCELSIVINTTEDID